MVVTGAHRPRPSRGWVWGGAPGRRPAVTSDANWTNGLKPGRKALTPPVRAGLAGPRPGDPPGLFSGKGRDDAAHVQSCPASRDRRGDRVPGARRAHAHHAAGRGPGLERVPPGLLRHPGHLRAGRPGQRRARRRAARGGLPRLAVEPERRRAEHVGRLRRHAPDRPAGDGRVQRREGRQQPRAARPGRLAAPGRRAHRHRRGAAAQRRGGQHLRRCRRARVVPAGHHRPASRRLEQGGRAQRRHRRPGRGPALRRHGLRRAAHRRHRDHRHR